MNTVSNLLLPDRVVDTPAFTCLPDQAGEADFLKPRSKSQPFLIPANGHNPTEPAMDIPVALIDRVLAFADHYYAKGQLESARDFLFLCNSLKAPDASRLKTLGAIQFQLGQFAEARTVLEQASQLDPRDPQVWLQLALCDRSLNQMPAFERNLKRALDADPAHFESVHTLASYFLDQRDYPAAGRLFLQLLKQAPEHIDMLLALGKCLYHGGDHETAITVYERILVIQPDNAVASEALAILRQELNAAASRKDSATPAPVAGGPCQAGTVPRTVDILLIQAEAAFAEGQLDQASDALRRAVTHAPNHAQLWASLGAIDFQRGEFSAAFQSFQKATALDPKSADAWVQLALASLRLKNADQFEAALTQALNLVPDHPVALKLLADLNLEQGHIAAAARLYNQLLQKDRDNVEILLLLGKCFYRADDRESSLLCYERVLQLEPANTFALEAREILKPKTPPNPLDTILSQADQAFARGNLPLAGQLLSQALELCPDSVEILRALAGIKFQMGQIGPQTEALHHLSRAAELRPKDIPTQLQLAAAAQSLAIEDVFQTAVVRVLDLQPDNPDALRLMANFLFQKERFQDAAGIAQKLLNRDFQDTSMLLLLGNCFYRLNDLDTAREVYQQVLQVDPSNPVAQDNLQVVEKSLSL